MVTVGGEIKQDEVADLLDRLVAKSLVTFDEATSRYRCLETVRQYAREQHVAALDAGAQDPRAKHAKFFYDLLSNQKDLSGPAAIAQTDADYENMRQALDWWSMQTDGDEAFTMASNLYSYWFARGMLIEGSQRMASLLHDRAADKNLAYGNLLIGFGDFSVHLGNFKEGRKAFEDALAIGEETNDVRLRALAFSGLAGLHQDHEVDYHLSRTYRLQALEMMKSLPDSSASVARHYYNLGDLTMKHHPDLYSDRRQDILLEARSFFEKAQEMSAGQGNSRLTFYLCAGLGGVCFHSGDIGSAKKYALMGLRYCIDSKYKIGEAANLALLAFCAEEVKRFDICTTLLGACIQISERTGFVPGAKEQMEALKTLDVCREHLGDQKFEDLLERGKSMSATELLHLAESDIKT